MLVMKFTLGNISESLVNHFIEILSYMTPFIHYLFLSYGVTKKVLYIWNYLHNASFYKSRTTDGGSNNMRERQKDTADEGLMIFAL